MKSWAYAGLFLFHALFTVYGFAAAKDKFYFGVALAKAYDNFRYTVQDTETGSSLVRNASSTATVANVFAGYGFTSAKGFYLGSELGTSFPARKTGFKRFSLSTNDMLQTDLAVEDYVTGDILPGYRFYKNALLYTRLGVTFSHLTRLEQSMIFPGVQLVGNKNRWGSRLGGGVNFQLTPHFSIEMNYIYLNYQAFNHPMLDLGVRFRQKLQSHYTGLSFIYSV
ncbi:MULTISPECIES: outer membrane protein [unclassified Legionella]|uniref:outer membrane protein n=1 Tax=unclassified Legionella TaxID=2622702 RepID=UPI0013EF821B|nr:outer membrane beta-barrel protein [Legionella sp. W10-070]MDI9819920.1 outer membrane beta-barrel protein [Legionella sp. PL877]